MGVDGVKTSKWKGNVRAISKAERGWCVVTRQQMSGGHMMEGGKVFGEVVVGHIGPIPFVHICPGSYPSWQKWNCFCLLVKVGVNGFSSNINLHLSSLQPRNDLSSQSIVFHFFVLIFYLKYVIKYHKILGYFFKISF